MRSLDAVRRMVADRMRAVPSLHEYQWEGVAFLLRSRSALLADEMGLGKTVQAIVALSILLGDCRAIERALVVAPASLSANWMAELAMWAPDVTVRQVRGDGEDRAAYYMLPIPVLVASYEHVRDDALERIPRDAFDLVILDEAQRIKNPESATALACRVLPRKRAWALSGTPLENRVEDLVSILGFLDGELSASRARADVKRRLEAIMLRRRKRDVRSELPSVIVQDLQMELSDRQSERYHDLWTGRRSSVVDTEHGGLSGSAMLGLITRLKGICNFDSVSGSSAKLEALRTVTEGAGRDARIIVFSQFVATLRWIAERLEISHGMVEGSMPVAERESVMVEFREGRSPRCLLVSLRAGGVGLNLGEATHVVLFDRWWNPAVEAQAMYRAHRFEREDPLHVVRFLVRNTIEERIAEILEKKESLFQETVDGGENGTLSRRDLVDVLDLAGAAEGPIRG